MWPTLCLVTCALASGQANGSSEWLIVPGLTRGQELVYSGTYAEESIRQGVKFTRHYQLETRALVLDSSSTSVQVALFTAVKFQGHQPASETNEPRSARLEQVRVDLQGRVSAERGIAVPLDGPPTLETGTFVEFPNGRVGPDKTWEVMEEGRPPRSWKVIGTEPISGVLCLKLTGLQQTADWDHARADQAAWRRQDTVWVSPGAGYASRLERVIERREPGRQEPGQRLVVNYHLESSLVYPRQLLDIRRVEIARFQSFAEAAQLLLRNPGQTGQRVFDSLLNQISYHCENQPPTPYRDALLQLQRRLDAARKGDALPVRSEEEASASSVVTGQMAPDFVAPDLVTRQTVRLQRLLGHPILLVFYQPTSRNADEVLRFAQSLNDSSTQVLGVCMVGDGPDILQQRRDLGITFPIVSGTGLRSIYQVETTPKLVVIDAAGTVRGAFEGWGDETPDMVRKELRRWLSTRRN